MPYAQKDARNAASMAYVRRKYRQVKVNIPIPLAERFREVTAARGDSQAAIIRQAIEDYLARVERETDAADKADEELW